jgi:phage terminase large subunit
MSDLATDLIDAFLEDVFDERDTPEGRIEREIDEQIARIPQYRTRAGFDDYRVKASMSDEQAANYLRCGNVPMPHQLAFSVAARLCDLVNGPTEIGIGGARGPGKSWIVFAQAIDDALRFPGLKILYLRHTESSVREQFQDLASKLLRHVPSARIQRNRVVFANGSVILVGGFKDDRQALRYQGIEYDILIIEEATQLAEKTYRTLRLSVRSSKVYNGVPFRPRVYLSTNPLGIGHTWFKQRFVDNERARERGEEYNPKRKFIFATVDDNVFVNEDYVEILDELSDAEYRAYRLGDWNVSAGAYFDNFSEDIHVIPPIEDLSYMVRIWCSMDFGFNHPNVVYLHAEDGDGITYTLDELIHRKRHPDEIAADVKTWLGQYGLTRDDLDWFLVGADAFAKTGRSRSTVAQQYQAQGLPMTRAYVQPGSRMEGALHLSKALGSRERGISPTWYCTTKCKRLRQTLPYLERDPNNAESVRKVDADDQGRGGDDAYDAAIYGLYHPHAAVIL